MDYEKLYNSYYMQVYSYAVALTKNPEQAEEIAQHTFVKALSSKAGYKGKSSELTWLCSIAKNLYYDELRRNQRLSSLGENLHISSEVDIEQAVSDSDMAFRIHLVLHKLDEPYKEVFLLSVFGGFSLKDISALFGKSESWARVTYYRAKQKLLEEMR